MCVTVFLCAAGGRVTGVVRWVSFGFILRYSTCSILMNCLSGLSDTLLAPQDFPSP